MGVNRFANNTILWVRAPRGPLAGSRNAPASQKYTGNSEGTA
jgi:hypothetical protein